MSLTVTSCLLAFAAPPVPQIVAGPVRVFVGIPTRDGFVDTSRGVGDSVKDVSRQVESIPGLKCRTSAFRLRIFNKDVQAHQ